MSKNRNDLGAAASGFGKAILGTSCHVACLAFVANGLLVEPSSAAFTPYTPSTNQQTTVAASICAQQVDNLVIGLTIASLASQGGGIAAQAAAIVVPVLGPVLSAVGILAQAAALATQAGAYGVQTQAQQTLPNCDTNFLGSVQVLQGGTNVTGDSIFNNNLAVTGNLTANALNTTQGISAYAGALWIGNTDGVSFQPGISIGGGALAGLGTGGAPSFTGNAAAIAIGNNASALLSGGVALGLNASSQGANAAAVGAGATAVGASSSAFGHQAFAGGLDSVSFGANSKANAPMSTAVGFASTASGASSVAVGDTAKATMSGAVAVGQNASATGIDSIAVGHGATATGSVAIGAGATAANGGAAYGDGSTATGLRSTALGPNANATFADSIAIGSNSVALFDDVVSFGSPGHARRLMNVAEGVFPTDAVNVNQLTRAVNGLNRGLAASIALSTPMMSLDPGETGFAMGGGFYQNAQGVGMTIAHRFEGTTPIMIDAGVGSAGDDSTVGHVGFSVKW